MARTRTLVLLPAIAAAAFSPLLRAGAAGYDVEIKGLTFIPEDIAVGAGDSVTWVNHDSDDHDLGGGTVDSPVMKTGDTFTFTFNEPGDVEYRCKIHTYMTGIVRVAPGDGTQAPPPPTTSPPTTAPTTTTTAPSPYPPLGLVP